MYRDQREGERREVGVQTVRVEELDLVTVTRWWCSVTGGGLPVVGSTLLDRSRVRTVGCGSGSEPHSLCPGPHLLFMVLYDGGPPAVYGLGTPDQGAGQGPSWPLGQLVEINSNILPLDLILYFNFKL
jgi:hypothetical protein